MKYKRNNGHGLNYYTITLSIPSCHYLHLKIECRWISSAGTRSSFELQFLEDGD